MTLGGHINNRHHLSHQDLACFAIATLNLAALICMDLGVGFCESLNHATLPGEFCYIVAFSTSGALCMVDFEIQWNRGVAIMQALLVCEASQKRSTVFAASRFACTALYGLLGAAAPAAANFAALAIKHIQHDTITGKASPQSTSSMTPSLVGTPNIA